LSYIRFIAPGVIRYTCGRYSRDDLADCVKTVARDLETIGLTVDDLKNNILLLDFLAEGHDPEIIQPLIDYLSGLIGIDCIRVLFNAVIDPDPLPYRARSFATHFVTRDGRFVNSGDQSEVKLQTKFLCLARRPTPGRAQFISQLLAQVPDVRASFGSGFPEWSQEFQSYFSVRELPIQIDGDAQRYVHNLASDVFRTCLFNLILETSSQSDPNSWRSVFMTEKTFKSFDLYQIPVWFAVPGTVAQVRKLGFDLFDDIVDHSYDTIVDEADRRNLIITQIKNLDHQFNLDDCQSLRKNIWRRLQSNYQLLDRLTNQYEQIQDQLINELTYVHRI
jgi:hypothetical protein